VGDESIWSAHACIPLSDTPYLYPVPYLLTSVLSAYVMKDSLEIASSTCVVRRVLVVLGLKRVNQCGCDGSPTIRKVEELGAPCIDG
jgi:hypothetical protein